VSVRARRHFPGLNSLRAYAALLVVLGHIPLNQASVGLPDPHWGAVFYRGEPAVCFFFALSGFLITYLLLEEAGQRGDVDVRAFYLRRIFRIWPLYLLVVGFGLVFYNLVLPRLGIAYQVEYSVPLAAGLYVLFLPNLMNSLYTVGGILNPTWSIGIEEQFYLAWAPVVRRFQRRLLWVCGAVGTLSLASFAFHHLNPLDLREMQKFFLQLKFHFMAAGGAVAWLLFYRSERLLALPVFTRPWLQWLLFLFLLQYCLVDLVHMPWFVEEVVQMVLYSWLILELGANSRNRLRIYGRGTEWLGKISYGIYMYHMVAAYATSWLFLRTDWWRGRPLLYVIAYYGLVLGLTVLLSYLSFRFYEGPFLALKNRFGRARPLTTSEEGSLTLLRSGERTP
jgi:peptidoglycan/LPS O-acetylase OafA/YrhL